MAPRPPNQGVMMQGSIRRMLVAAGVGSLAMAGASLFTAAPASAEPNCVQVRVWVAGSPTPVGTCVTVVSAWAAPCVEADVFPLGYGAGATVCLETPV